MREYKIVPCSPRVNDRVINVSSPEQAVEYFNLTQRHDQKETLMVIIVNTRLNAVGHHIVSIGTVNESMAHPREILRPVIIQAGYGFILAHNHPSGDPSPSSADRVITKRVREAADIMQLNFLDHVIVPDCPDPHESQFFSFREAGLL